MRKSGSWLSPSPLNGLIEATVGTTGETYFYALVRELAQFLQIDSVFLASCAEGDGDDYLNCPMNEPEYEAFIDALLSAELAPLHEFDTTPYFEGCMPIEVMAQRGRETPRFGPMKPVGLTDPRT